MKVYTLISWLFTYSSASTVSNLLTTTKTPTPEPKTTHSVYSIPCKDYTATYIGQTYRPLQKRIEEHERSYRRDQATDDYGNIKSAPALHAHITEHTIGWNDTSILTIVKTRPQLDLVEHAAIKTLNPIFNINLAGPHINTLWNPILPKICESLKSRPSNVIKF